jgi:hypothetical protein
MWHYGYEIENEYLKLNNIQTILLTQVEKGRFKQDKSVCRLISLSVGQNDSI